jgi:ADP-heptose:LPS heptosyltransferase
VKKLVLFEFHLLGDAVMSLPFLRAVRTKYDVYVCCSPVAAKAYELVLPAGRIFRTGLPSWKPGKHSEGVDPAALAAVRDLRADLGVTVWADVRVHLLMRKLGISERIGFPMNERNYYGHHVGWRARNLRIGRFIQTAAKIVGIQPVTTALERLDYSQHHITTWAQMGESLGLSLDLETPWLEAPKLPDMARVFFERNAGRKIWLLHPGAAREWRRWPHFQQLVDTVLGPAQAPLVIVQDPAAPGVRPPHDNCLVWTMSSLADFVAVVARCDVVLCNDSAAGHIGAALRKHVVAIFTSGSSDWFAPWSERTLIESTCCPYRPCLDRCLQPSYICREEITLERVAGPVQKVLKSLKTEGEQAI